MRLAGLVAWGTAGTAQQAHLHERRPWCPGLPGPPHGSTSTEGLSWLGVGAAAQPSPPPSLLLRCLFISSLLSCLETQNSFHFITCDKAALGVGVLRRGLRRRKNDHQGDIGEQKGLLRPGAILLTFPWVCCGDRCALEPVVGALGAGHPQAGSHPRGSATAQEWGSLLSLGRGGGAPSMELKSWAEGPHSACRWTWSLHLLHAGSGTGGEEVLGGGLGLRASCCHLPPGAASSELGDL